jgi:hypothetical protein
MLTYHQRSIATIALCLLLAACSVPQPDGGHIPTATAETQATQVLPQATLTTAPSTSAATPPPAATLPPTSSPPSATATPNPTATKRPLSTPSSAPLIISFTVTPTVVTPGDSVTLSWQAIGERAVICSAPSFLGSNCFDVPLAGSQKIIIDEKDLSYQFNLRVEAGQVDTSQDVYICTGKNDWFFALPANWQPADWCTTAPPLNSHAAAQRFEHGLMIWIEARDEFLIFFDNHSYWSSYWYSHPIQLKPGASENHRVGNVPAGLYQPVSGFGLLWRGEVVGADDIREQLGWAQQPEFGFETTYQCAMPVNIYTLNDCYLRGPQKILHFHGHHSTGYFWEELASP